MRFFRMITLYKSFKSSIKILDILPSLPAKSLTEM